MWNVTERVRARVSTEETAALAQSTGLLSAAWLEKHTEMNAWPSGTDAVSCARVIVPVATANCPQHARVTSPRSAATMAKSTTTNALPNLRGRSVGLSVCVLTK